MILYYIRHGEPDYEKDCLTELGQKEAEALVPFFKKKGVDKIFSSSMGRALETAKPTANAFSLPITLCDWAREDKAWENYTAELEKGRRTWLFWHPKWVDEFNSEESIQAGYSFYKLPVYDEINIKKGIEFTDKSVDEFMLSLGYKHNREKRCYEEIRKNDEHVCLFAHHGFGLAFLSSLLDIPYSFFSLRFDMGHTNVTEIEFMPDAKGNVFPKIMHLANDAHLYKEDIGFNQKRTEIYIEEKK